MVRVDLLQDLGAEVPEQMNGFPVLRADDGEVLEVEGLCMSCQKQGMTKIMPASIPWYV